VFRTIRHLSDVNPGFDIQHITTFQVGVSHSLTKTAPSTRTAYQQLIERIRQIPGVQGADFTGFSSANGGGDYALLDWLAEAGFRFRALPA